MPRRFQTPEFGASETGVAGPERRAREIINGLRDAFLSLDSQWRITGCNSGAESILGRTSEELLGRALWEVIGISRGSPLGEAAQRVIDTGSPEESEVTLEVAGAERLLIVRAFPLGGGVGVTAGDLTDLRALARRLAESEARFRDLALIAPVPTWATGADGTFEHASPAMLDTLRLTEGEVVGSRWERLIHPDDVAAFQQAMHKAKAEHEGLQHTTRVRRGDGALRTLQLSGVPRFDAGGAANGYVGMTTDVTELVATQQRQQLLINELNHRVKNSLATVQSIVRQTLRGSPVGKETIDLLTERLVALAAAHDLLTRENWHSVELRGMARQAVQPFDPDASRIEIQGPTVWLYPSAALALFIALNELATNAMRHGALSAPEGRVELSWTERGGALDLQWRERGGPPVSPPTHKGFGSRLLDTGLQSELGAPAEITYAPEGLLCRIHAAGGGIFVAQTRRPPPLSGDAPSLPPPG